MAGGRPTDDPKETLVAVRLSDRQLVPLQRRARIEGTSLSEALRRVVDDWSRGYTRTRSPTAAERETFKQLSAAFRSEPARRRPRRR
jgi:hypothetical protein